MIRAAFLTLALLRCGAALADDEPPKVRATSFLISHKDVDEALLVPGMHKLDDALRRNPRLEMKDLDARIADFAQEVPSDQVEEGRKQLTEGEQALAQHQLPAALKALRTAVETLSKVLPFVKKQELAEAMVALGVAECEGGNKREGRAQFQRVLTWRSDEKYDLSKFSSKYLALFEDARKELLRGKRGSLEIHSDPPAAQTYVDGRYVGVTPTFADGLLIGEHFITLKRQGYHKAVQAATVSSKVQGTVEIKLDHEPKFLLVDEALHAVDPQLGHDQLESNVDNLKEVLFIDHAVFVRATRLQPGRLRLESFLYDLRSRRRLSSETREVADNEVEAALAKTADALYVNVRYEGDLQAPADEPIPLAKPAPKPVYKRWWFWTVIGAAAVGVGLTAGLLAEKYKPVNCNTASDSCFGFNF